MRERVCCLLVVMQEAGSNSVVLQGAGSEPAVMQGAGPGPGRAEVGVVTTGALLAVVMQGFERQMVGSVGVGEGSEP